MVNTENYLYDLNLINFKPASNGKYNAQCNVCGDDAEKKATNARLWFTPHEDTYFVKCYNGGCPLNKTTNFDMYLGMVDKNLQAKYREEKRDESYNYIKENRSFRNNYKPKEFKPEKIKTRFKKTLNSKFFKALPQEAIDYCIKRKIPKDVYSKFYWGVHPEKRWNNTMIMPLYRNSDNAIYGFVGRAIDKKKFVFIRFSKDNSIYNIFNIDNSKPVYIFESIIDSLVMPNSIAMLTSDINDELLNQIKNPIFVYDNDETGINTSLERFKDGFKCVIFSDDIKYKDCNQMLVDAVYDSSDIQRIILSNIYETELGIMECYRIIKKRKY